MTVPDPHKAAPTPGVFGNGSANGSTSTTQPVTPGDILESARVDLVDYLLTGIPPRQFVPGCHGRFAAGKRHHLAADRKSGKSIAVGVVDVVDIIEAGGTVAVLDRENGEDEYARRLDDVLKARHADTALIAAVRERFRYYAWPSVRLEWATNDAYPAAFAGVDLVIFDSSRKFLTHVKLEENKSDDYSRFAEALIDPLMRAGIATLILDNVGHEEKRRSRGTISKEDLADVIFSMTKTIEFNRDKTGRVELACEDSRFGDIHGRWTMEIGGGVYEQWDRPQENLKETFRLAVVAALLEKAPLGRDDLIKAARAKGAKGRNTTLRAWLEEFAGDLTSGVTKCPGGYAPEGWPHSGGHAGPSSPEAQPGPLAPPEGARADPGLGPHVGAEADERRANWRSYKSPVEDDEDDERKDLM